MAKSIKEMAQQSLDVQNACNASGVIHTLASIMTELWAYAHANGHGTEWVNTHPIVTMFLYKLSSLNGHDNYSSHVLAAYEAVTAMVENDGELVIHPNDGQEKFAVTGAQYKALHRKFEQNSDGSPTFEHFRARARNCRDYIMLQWCGMFLGIEKDGYTHS